MEIINRCTNCRNCGIDLTKDEWRLCGDCRILEQRQTWSQAIQGMYDILIEAGDECDEELRGLVMGSISEYEQELIKLEQ